MEKTWLSCDAKRFLYVSHHLAAGVRTAFSRVCLFVCLFVCPRFKRKTAWAINTKLGTNSLYSIALAQHTLTLRSKGQRSKVKGQSHRGIISTRRGYACRFDCLCFLVPDCSKQLSYRRGTARHTVSWIQFLSTGTAVWKHILKRHAVGERPWRLLKVIGIAAMSRRISDL